MGKGKGKLEQGRQHRPEIQRGPKANKSQVQQYWHWPLHRAWQWPWESHDKAKTDSKHSDTRSLPFTQPFFWLSLITGHLFVTSTSQPKPGAKPEPGLTKGHTASDHPHWCQCFPTGGLPDPPRAPAFPISTEKRQPCFPNPLPSSTLQVDCAQTLGIADLMNSLWGATQPIQMLKMLPISGERLPIPISCLLKLRTL